MPQDVIRRLCALTEEVAAQRFAFKSPSDCFCKEGGYWNTKDYDPERDYRNDGEVLAYIERVVRADLRRRQRRLAQRQ